MSSSGVPASTEDNVCKELPDREGGKPVVGEARGRRVDIQVSALGGDWSGHYLYTLMIAGCKTSDRNWKARKWKHSFGGGLQTRPYEKKARRDWKMRLVKKAEVMGLSMPSQLKASLPVLVFLAGRAKLELIIRLGSYLPSSVLCRLIS